MILYSFLLGLSLLLFIAVAFAYLRHPAASLLHPASIYLGFHGLIFVVRPILARFYDYQAIYRGYEFQPSIDDKITVILGANLGFLVFMGVCLWVGRQPFANLRGEFDDLQRRLLVKPFLLAAILIAPIGLASILDQWINRASNSSTMILDRATLLSVNTTANGWFDSTQLALVPLVVGFAWFMRFRLWSLTPFVVYFVLRAGTGGRGPLITAALALVMLYLFEHRRRWPEWRSALLLIVAGLSFVAILQDRGKAVREVFVNDVSVEYNANYDLKPLEGMDFGNLEFFEYIVYAVPQRSGTYDYFASNLQIITEPVPRVFWKDKPVGSPVQPIRLTDYGYPIGMTMSVPGAGWYELGYLGIVIQCALFAAGYGWLYRVLMTKTQSNFYLLAYVMMIGATIVTYRDGVLISVLRLVPFYIGPFVLVWLLAIAFRVPGTERLRRLAASRPDRTTVPSTPAMTPAERRKLLAAQYAAR